MSRPRPAWTHLRSGHSWSCLASSIAVVSSSGPGVVRLIFACFVGRRLICGADSRTWSWSHTLCWCRTAWLSLLELSSHLGPLWTNLDQLSESWCCQVLVRPQSHSPRESPTFFGGSADAPSAWTCQKEEAYTPSTCWHLPCSSRSGTLLRCEDLYTDPHNYYLIVVASPRYCAVAVGRPKLSRAAAAGLMSSFRSICISYHSKRTARIAWSRAPWETFTDHRWTHPCIRLSSASHRTVSLHPHDALPYNLLFSCDHWLFLVTQSYCPSARTNCLSS